MSNEDPQFTAAPRVVQPKKKYKEKEPELEEEDDMYAYSYFSKLIYNNLMWDKRVVRGNTYSALVTTSKNAEIPYSNIFKEVKNEASHVDYEKNLEYGNKRANIEIYTDEHVETLTDKPPKYEYGAQTEFKIEKSIIRHSMPVKIGTDIETQIWDNELFDFDYEVEPLLSVLCARTLEISRMEVLQEQEFSIMKMRQMELKIYSHQEENLKVKGMYKKEDELEKENAKRLENFRKLKQKKVETHQRLFSRALGKSYLRDLNKNTVNIVEAQGFFRKEIDNQLVEKILPNLYSTSLKEQQIADEWKIEARRLMTLAKELALKHHKWSKEVERTRRNQVISKRNELNREMKERKQMKQEEKETINFLQEEKAHLEKEKEEERKRAEEAENGENADNGEQNEQN